MDHHLDGRRDPRRLGCSRSRARDVHRGWAATDLNVLSSVFLRMIKSLIVPLLFATLVVGIAGHGDDMKRVGRLALRSIVYFEIVTTLALAVGLIAVNVVKPGRGVDLGAASAKEGAEFARDAHDADGRDRAHGSAELLRRGRARTKCCRSSSSRSSSPSRCRKVQGPSKTFMLSACESLSEVMFKFVNVVMGYAPIGIGAAIAVTVSKSGLGVLRNLGILVGDALRRADRVRRCSCCCPSRSSSACRSAVRARRSRAMAHRVHDGVVGGRVPAGDGADGAARRAAADRGVRAADGLLVQSGREHAVSGARVGVRGTGGGDRHADLARSWS